MVPWRLLVQLVPMSDRPMRPEHQPVLEKWSAHVLVGSFAQRLLPHSEN